MATGFWGLPCRRGSLWSTRRHRSKETSVARRAPIPSSTLEVRLTFEPSRGKRNKKVAVKLLLPVLTVLHLGLCSPTHHWPSSLEFVRHDARLHGFIASFSCVYG